MMGTHSEQPTAHAADQRQLKRSRSRRDAETTLAQAPPPAPAAPEAADAAALLAHWHNVNSWLKNEVHTEQHGEGAIDAGADILSEAFDAVEAAPCDSVEAALAKLRLLQADDDAMGVCSDETKRPIIDQVAEFLASLVQLPPADAELAAMLPTWERLSAEHSRRVKVHNARINAARRETDALPGLTQMSSDQRWEAYCEAERRHGVYEEVADCDAIADQMDVLLNRARQLEATTLRGLAVKVAMCAENHIADGSSDATDELLRNLGLIVRHPFMMAKVRESEFFTPYQWVNAFLEAGGTFSRHPDGSLFMGSPVSPCSDGVEDLKRGLGLVPNVDGAWSKPPEGFLDEVWECVQMRMDRNNKSVLVDNEAQQRRARLVAVRLADVQPLEAA